LLAFTSCDYTNQTKTSICQVLSNSPLLSLFSSYFFELRIPVGETIRTIPKPENVIVSSEESIPALARRVTFSDEFDYPLHKLPSSVTHLAFGNAFSQPVDHLPSSLIHISFGKHFNQQVDVLPPKITHIYFGDEFNQTVENLPPSLTHLNFGNNFNQQIDNLPQSITHLSLKRNFVQPLHNLPASLTLLEINSQAITPHIPTTIDFINTCIEENKLWQKIEGLKNLVQQKQKELQKKGFKEYEPKVRPPLLSSVPKFPPFPHTNIMLRCRVFDRCMYDINGLPFS
jgi:FNIP Repeat